MQTIPVRGLALVALCGCLSGCALPPALTVASWAADGISFLSSNKTLSDHALSIATTQDCSLKRILDGEDICRDFEPGEMPEMVAAAAEWARSEEQIGMDYDVQPDLQFASLSRGPHEGDAPGTAPGKAPVTMLASSDAPAPVLGFATGPQTQGWSIIPASYRPAPRSADAAEPDSKPRDAAAAKRDALADERVVVLGSFAAEVNAERAAELWARFDVRVVEAHLGERTYFRVVTDPVAAEAIDVLKSSLRKAGLAGAWTAPLCSADTATGCVSLATKREIQS